MAPCASTTRHMRCRVHAHKSSWRDDLLEVLQRGYRHYIYGYPSWRRHLRISVSGKNYGRRKHRENHQ